MKNRTTNNTLYLLVNSWLVVYLVNYLFLMVYVELKKNIDHRTVHNCQIYYIGLVWVTILF